MKFYLQFSVLIEVGDALYETTHLIYHASHHMDHHSVHNLRVDRIDLQANARMNQNGHENYFLLFITEINLGCQNFKCEINFTLISPYACCDCICRLV